MLRRAQKALRPVAGVCGPGDLAVAQNGTPNMSVNVAAGQAIIDGTENAVLQGSYIVTNDAVVNKVVAASDPTNPRNDLVVAKIQDAFYSGGTTTFSIAVVTGTPAGSPVDPAVPANSITLARIRVDATVGTIVNAKITDLRPNVQGAIYPGAAGYTIWDSTGLLKNAAWTDAGLMTLRNAALIPPAAGATLPPTSYGTQWLKIDEQPGAATVRIPASGSLPSQFRHLWIEYLVRDSGAGASWQYFTVQYNGVSTATYDDDFGVTFGGTTQAPNEFLGQTSHRVGACIQGAAPANLYASGRIIIPGYSLSIQEKLAHIHCVWAYGTASGNLRTLDGISHWRNAAAITSIVLATLAADSLNANSLITTYAAP